MKNIYFVRHGECRSNLTGVLEGASSPLTEKGIEQAKVIAKRISKISVDVLMSSAMLRAKQTAEEINKIIKIPIIINELIHEKNKPKSFYGMNTKSEEYIKLNHQYESGKLSGDIIAGGETFDDLVLRVNKVLEMIKNIAGDNIVIVTHGVFLRVIICKIIFGENVNVENYFKFLHSTVMNNTGITHVVYDESDKCININGGWRLKSWNDSSHLG